MLNISIRVFMLFWVVSSHAADLNDLETRGLKSSIVRTLSAVCREINPKRILVVSAVLCVGCSWWNSNEPIQNDAEGKELVMPLLNFRQWDLKGPEPLNNLQSLENVAFSHALRNACEKEVVRQRLCNQQELCQYVGGRDVLSVEGWEVLNPYNVQEAHIILGINPKGESSLLYSHPPYAEQAHQALMKAIRNARKTKLVLYKSDRSKVQTLTIAAQTLQRESWGRITKIRGS